MQQGKYPSTFYRVSVKAVIENSEGKILSVREGDDWTLPGGGIDHGEDPITALKRELYEEAFIETDFKAEAIGTEWFYSESKDTMAFWIIYKLTMADDAFSFKPGEDADDVAFRDAVNFKDDPSLFGQIIYKYGIVSV